MRHDINVGVIGVGSMGKNHARVYSEIANLIGVADVDVSTAKDVAKRLGTEWYGDYHTLLSKNVEAVSVAVPTQHHHKVAMDVIKAGKHLLVEKPLSIDMKEAYDIVDSAEKHGLTLAVGFIERHNPAVLFIKNQLKNGMLGNVITASSRRVSSFPQRIRDVGVILDLGVHDIDVMRYLIGEKVTRVYAVGGRNGNHKFETHANITLTFESGVVGYVETNWLTPMKVRKLWLTCKTEYVEMDYISQCVRISEAKLLEYDSMNLFKVPYEYNIREYSLKKEEPLKNELNDFLTAIESGGTPLVTGQEAIETTAVALAAIESMRKRSAVEI